MGKPPSSRPYRDNPSLEDAVSLHTTPDDVAQLLTEPSALAIPPPYQDDEDEIPDPNQVSLPVNRYAMPMLNSKYQRSDGTYYVIGGFENDPAYIEWCVKRWAAIPPSILVRIVGKHRETHKNGDKTEQKVITDFDLKLRLTEYLFTHPNHSAYMELKTVDNAEKTYRGSIIKKAEPVPATDLERPKAELKEWCHRFDANHSALKMFLFKREVVGLNKGFLREHIESLIRSTNYKGRINVTFPIENPGVEIWSQHWINMWRNSTLICILFYVSMLWIFSWTYLFFATKKYAVVKAVWPFSVERDEGLVCYATMSEGQWFTRWQKAIEKAVLQRQQTTLTEEDLARLDEPAPETGNQVLDSAIGFIGAGTRIYQEVNRQVGWGYDT